MGAHKLDDYEHKLKYPVMVQHKLDGVRCIAIFDKDGNVTLYSKHMKPFIHLDHIKDELKRYKLKNTYLDGELYSHGLKLNEIMSYVMKKRTLTHDEEEASKKILFMVFDIIQINIPFDKRYSYLQSIFYKKKNVYVQIVNCDIAHNKEEVYKLNDQYLMEGYEGVIVRNRDGFYVFKRSYDVLRTKEFKHGIFTILGGKMGKGTHKNTLIWELQCNQTSNRSKSFHAIQLGTLQERRALYHMYQKDPSQFIGKRVNVKYLSIDDYGCVLRNPIVESFI